MKLVIFDCDGTIVDSQHAIAASMFAAFEEHGLPRPARQDVLGVVGLSLIEAVNRLLPATAEQETALVVANSYKRAFADLRQQAGHHEPLYPGALDAIRALAARKDMLLGIATGKSRRGVDALFEREGLAPFFVTVQTADEHPSKPHPSMIFEAMLEVGAEAPDTVMIGDTTYDIEMARAADVSALGVDWGYHPATLLEAAGAHEIARQYADVPAAVDRLIGGDGEAAA